MTLVVDRIEGEYVICEDVSTLETAQYHKTLMPDGIREGDVVVFQDGEFIIDYGQTVAREQEANELLRKLMGNYYSSPDNS